ncbi:hypothetical protein EV182_005489 [Spiromyces aspiralis]|uniref:Uncharacterized protein n=1 Tax=Spiromyces aspiralis TaxID=68401 RepID=A0ACC1HG51_9FUNG|nr:hypothetical protein EV182_005489 [Spiromyces aspiralis]
MDRASNTHSHISSEPTRSKLEVASNIAERYVLPDGEVIIKPRIKQLSEIETLVEMWVDFCNVWKFIEAHRSNNLEGHPLNKIEKKRMWEWRRMIEEVLYTLAHRKKEPMPHTQRQQLWTPELYSRFNEIKEMCATLDIERSKLHPSSRRWGTFKKHLVYLRNGGGDDRGRDNGNETSHSEA